ncbi:MAG: C25 family cysteine peptidase, partial [Ignavibacteriaceae bacterium]
MKNAVLSFLIFLFFSFNLFSQVSHTVNFSLEKLTVWDATGLDKTIYTKVVYGDLQKTDEVGKPELPVKYINLIIPSGQKVKDIKLTLSNQKNFSITAPVYPAQPDIPTSIHTQEVKFVEPNFQTYNSEEPYPDKRVKLVHDGYFDGNNHIITLAVYPLQYTPKLNQLTFYSNINIILELEATATVNINIRNRKSSNQLLYNNVLKNMVDNTQDVEAYQLKPMTLGKESETETINCYEYVIITSNALKNSFDKFIEWKKRKGIDIGVVTTEDILSTYSGDLISGIYDDAGKIRQFLYESYLGGTVLALLAGDYTVVPIRYGAGSINCDWNKYNSASGYRIPSDLYFSDFTGDWDVDGTDGDGAIRYGEPNGTSGDLPDYLPEIYVGRLLCTNAEEISNWTEKIIKYEQNPGRGNTSYLTRSFMFESDQMQDGNEAEGVANLLTSFSHKVWRELPSYNSSSPTFPTGSQVIDEMNYTRYGLWSWFGHGDVPRVNTMTNGVNLAPRYQISSLDEIFTDPAETGNGLDNLNNLGYPGIVYSISCDITPFDDFNPNNWWNDTDRNMGEGFTVVSKNGGPALLGNTRFGYVTSSSLLYRQFANLIEGGITYLGVAELISKNNYHSHYLSYSHNLIGCPETQIWVNTPSQFTGASVTDGGSYLTVNVGVSGCVINVRSVNDGLNYNSSAEDVSSYTFNTSIRPLFVTITKSQYLPYTAITGGTLTTDATLWGKLNVLSNITVQSGRTLTIEPGTILNFASNASLVVNGVMNSVGTSSEPITFTSQSGTTNSSWGTITFSGSGASGSTIKYANIKYGTRIQVTNTSNITFQYCNIDTCYDAVDFYNSTGSVLNNSITSNSVGHGIIIEQGSSATCNYNTLTKTHTDRRGVGILFRGGATGSAAQNDIYHWDWGIGAIWSSSPTSYSSNIIDKNNRIRNCNTGFMVYRLSQPTFGFPAPSDYWNFNSISGNSYNARVGTSYPDYESRLIAANNWWGSNPPNTSLFQVGSLSQFVYDPYLFSDPWAGFAKAVADNNESSENEAEISQGLSEDINLILYGNELRLQNKYNEAKNYFTSYITEHPDNQAAYVELYNCYNGETADEIIKFFEALPEKASKDHKLLLSYLYLKEGNFKEAKEVNNSIIAENQNTELATRAKLNNVYIALYNEDNISEAITTFNEVM